MSTSLLLLICILRSASSVPVFRRQAAVSELGSIRDRTSRFGGNLGEGWGLDWSGRLLPTSKNENSATQYQVSSASNARGNIRSPNFVSMASNSYPIRRQFAHNLGYNSRNPSFSSPYLLHHWKSRRTAPPVRFETSPSSSVSNGDNLSNFAYHLNRVSSHRRKSSMNRVPVQTMYGTRMENQYENNSSLKSKEETEINPSFRSESEMVEKLFNESDEMEGEDMNYPDIIVSSTFNLGPSLSNHTMAVNDNDYEDNESSNEKSDENTIVTSNEIRGKIDGHLPSSTPTNSAGERTVYQHFLLGDSKDLQKLIENDEESNVIITDAHDSMDTGKSFDNVLDSRSDKILLMPDYSMDPTVENEHNVIYLKIVPPKLRLKGSKLKEPLDTSNENGVAHEFGFVLPETAKGGTQRYRENLGQSSMKFDRIENQIAAVNRIGNAEPSEIIKLEGTEQKMSENLSPRPRLDDTNSLDDGHSSIDFEIQKLDHSATAKSKPNLKNFPDVEQRSSSSTNQNKQLSSGSRSNYPPTTVHGQQSSGTYIGYNQPGGQEKPYEQKYPGWANVQPYQYSEQDPLTGSFKFGYGDQYQWRHEERRTDGVVFGGYGWLDETGQHHVTRFVSDRLGYRVLPEGGEIDFSALPVYPPIKEDDQSSAGSQDGYNNLSFITPEPLPPPPSFVSFPPSPPSAQSSVPTPDENIPQVHPPVTYPGSILPLIEAASNSESVTSNVASGNYNIGVLNSAINPGHSNGSSAIPQSILDSLIQQEIAQRKKARGEYEITTPVESLVQRSQSLASFASAVNRASQQQNYRGLMNSFNSGNAEEHKSSRTSHVDDKTPTAVGESRDTGAQQFNSIINDEEEIFTTYRPFTIDFGESSKNVDSVPKPGDSLRSGNADRQNRIWSSSVIRLETSVRQNMNDFGAKTEYYKKPSNEIEKFSFYSPKNNNEKHEDDQTHFQEDAVFEGDFGSKIRTDGTEDTSEVVNETAEWESPVYKGSLKWKIPVLGLFE